MIVSRMDCRVHGTIRMSYIKSVKCLLIMSLIAVVVMFLETSLQRKHSETDTRVTFNTNLEKKYNSNVITTTFSPPSNWMENVIAENAQNPKKNYISLCPDWPLHLVGIMNIKPNVSLENLAKETSMIKISYGGRYMPSNCKAKERTAVIIPYRDRKDHLDITVRHLHVVLQRQELEYGIYVVEMALPSQFNRGLLANAGVKTVRGIYNYSCYIIHDVDMLMNDDRNLYRCGKQPIHFVSYNSKFGNSSMFHTEYFGGVVGFTDEQYRQCNGFSNLYFGWGGEDDDLLIRVKSAGMKFVRPKEEIGKYVALHHYSDVSNPENPNRYALLSHAKARMMEEGVNSIQFKRLSLEYRKLYTWILIGVHEDIILQKYNQYLEDSTSKASQTISTTLRTNCFLNTWVILCLYFYYPEHV